MEERSTVELSYSRDIYNMHLVFPFLAWVNFNSTDDDNFLGAKKIFGERIRSNVIILIVLFARSLFRNRREA